jgi:hypothetical protein
MPDKKLTTTPPKKLGRPSSYTDHIAQVICLRISEGESLRKIVSDEGMPDKATVYRWLLERKDFCDNYARAREEQADTLADEIVDIADQVPFQITDKDGNIKIDSAYVQWQRNRIDARKWVASKLKATKYGDVLKHTGDQDNPLVVDVMAKEIVTSMIKNVEMKRQLANNAG